MEKFLKWTPAFIVRKEENHQFVRIPLATNSIDRTSAIMDLKLNR